MNRKIFWRSGCLDEIGLVYERVERDEKLSKLMEALETQALEEGRANCGLFRTSRGPLTLEQYDAMPEEEREQVLYRLGRAGIAGMDLDHSGATIHVKLSPLFGQVMACSFFALLNSLEKLDGSFNVLVSNKATLALYIPLGARRGLLRWELFLMSLYPWIECREESSGEMPIPAPVPQERKQAAPAEPKKTEQPPAAEPRKTEKKGFFARLFGKK